MEFSASAGWLLLGVGLVALSVVLQLAFERLLLSTGVCVLRTLAPGRWQLGGRRHQLAAAVRASPPGSWFFYVKDGARYAYRDRAGLLGLLVWLLLLLSIGAVTRAWS